MLYTLVIGIHKQLLRLRMLNKQRGTQSGPRLLDLRFPERQPEVLEGDKCCSEAIVDLRCVTEVLQVWHGLVVTEHHHGVLDSLEELSGPLDGAGDWRCVPDEWRVVLHEGEELVRLWIWYVGNNYSVHVLYVRIS